jgi:hypothetical protein
MSASLIALLIVFALIGLMAAHCELDWRYRQRKKAR